MLVVLIALAITAGMTVLATGINCAFSNASSTLNTTTRLLSKGVRTLYIEPGSPWENGYCESFGALLRRLRSELHDPRARGGWYRSERNPAPPSTGA